MKDGVSIKIRDIDEYMLYFKKVPLDVEDEVYKHYPKLRGNTKKIVKDNLTKGHGYQKGIYKKSIVQRNLAEDRTEIHFIVGANKKHYRLTHLLENGHGVKVGGKFVSPLKSTGTNLTTKIVHIAPAQEYANRVTYNLYTNAIKLAFRKAK